MLSREEFLRVARQATEFGRSTVGVQGAHSQLITHDQEQRGALAEKGEEIAKLKHELKQDEYKFIRNHNDYYKELCGMREQIDQLRTELDRVMGALEKIMIGGNHLALQITNSFGEHPLHDASFEEAAIFYKVGADGWDGQAWKYDVWICWKAIMQARPIFESWRARQGKEPKP